MQQRRSSTTSRRRFLGGLGAAAAWYGLGTNRAVQAATEVVEPDAIVAAETFGRLERLADGVYAAIATPVQ